MRENKKLIVINRMYAGEYIQDETNIGHEIINLYKTDNGDNFIYLQSHGTYHRSQANRFEAILLVRGVGNGIFEVLGKAEQIIELPVLSEKCGGTRYDSKEVARKHIHKKQLDIVKEYSINYGGVSINNLYKKNKDDDECIYVTFKAGKVRLPKQALYITDAKEKEDICRNIYYVTTQNGFAKQQLKMYFEENSDGYSNLKMLLENSDVWEENDTTEKIGDKLYLGDRETTFLDIIKKNNDEVIFSNLIVYYLSKYKPLLEKFIARFVNLNMRGEVKIFREKEHIDILFQDEEMNCVIIENKIKSGINGIIRNNEGEEIKNQLETYIETIKDTYKISDDKIECIALIPNYCHIDFNKYDHDGKYKKVTYKQLYEFFKEWVFGIADFAISDPYYIDFIKALKLHAKEVDNTLQEEMKRRFIASILTNK